MHGWEQSTYRAHADSSKNRQEGRPLIASGQRPANRQNGCGWIDVLHSPPQLMSRSCLRTPCYMHTQPFIACSFLVVVVVVLTLTRIIKSVVYSTAAVLPVRDTVAILPYVQIDFFFFFSSHFYFPASGQAVVTGVVPSPLRFLPSIFIAHRVQQSHCSSIFHRVLLTHALALSASQFEHKKKFQRIYTSMNATGLELTKLTYTRLEDNLIRHRGDRLCTIRLRCEALCPCCSNLRR